MLSKVGPDKRTFRDDAQPFTAGGVESGFDQDVAEMPTAEGQRNFRMNEYQGVGRPLVVQERHVTVHRKLESVCGAVVAHGNSGRRRDIVHGMDKERIMTYLAPCPKALHQFHW